MTLLCMLISYLHHCTHKGKQERRGQQRAHQWDGLSQPPLSTLFIFSPYPHPCISVTPRRYQQWGILSYNPNNAGSGHKSSPPSVNFFTIRKIPLDVPEKAVLSINACCKRLSIHPCHAQYIWFPVPTYREPYHPFLTCLTR